MPILNTFSQIDFRKKQEAGIDANINKTNQKINEDFVCFVDYVKKDKNNSIQYVEVWTDRDYIVLFNDFNYILC